MDKVRVSKLLSEQGLCSRREADVFIERGWVKADGKVVSLGDKVSPSAKLTLDKKALDLKSKQVTIILNKPVGYVSSQPEKNYKSALMLINKANQFDRAHNEFSPDHLKGLATAGRLDIESQGLLVMTQDGSIAKQLIGDDSEVEKEYIVRVEGKLSDRGLQLLNHGLSLDGHPLREAEVEWVNDDQLRFILWEGKKRQIRRMCELVGLKVVGLKRVRMGNVALADLPTGKWRYLKPFERFL